MIDFIASIVWWKWLIILVIFHIVYGVSIRLYTEYKIPLTRHGKWTKHYHYKINNLVKPRSSVLYLMFCLESIIGWMLVILMIVSLVSK